jgi:hypothetical protein
MARRAWSQDVSCENRAGLISTNNNDALSALKQMMITQLASATLVWSSKYVVVFAAAVLESGIAMFSFLNIAERDRCVDGLQ